MLMSNKQRVVFGGHSSDWFVVKYGVPQWSVHGPILFLLTDNDFMDNFTRLFADDCVLCGTTKVKMTLWRFKPI